MPPTADTQTAAAAVEMVEAAPAHPRRRDNLNGRFDYDDAAKNWKSQGDEAKRKQAILDADKASRRQAQLGQGEHSSDSSSGSDEDEHDYGSHKAADETVKGFEEFGNRHKLDR
jgi:hypothetical protein